MSNSETQSDYKIIETKINLMENMLDNYIENNSQSTTEQTQSQNEMSLAEAVELVLDMAEHSRENYSSDSHYRSKHDTAIAKVKHFNKQL